MAEASRDTGIEPQGNKRQWAQKEVLDALELVGKRFTEAEDTKGYLLRIGDISRKGGGPLPKRSGDHGSPTRSWPISRTSVASTSTSTSSSRTSS